jgi:hypothetical protein
VVPGFVLILLDSKPDVGVVVRVNVGERSPPVADAVTSRPEGILEAENHFTRTCPTLHVDDELVQPRG